MSIAGDISRRTALALGSAAALTATVPGGEILARLSSGAFTPEFASKMRLALAAMSELNGLRDRLRECHAKLAVLNPWGEESRNLRDWAIHYYVAQLKAEERAAIAAVRAHRAAPALQEDGGEMRKLCHAMWICTWKERVDMDPVDWNALEDKWREKRELAKARRARTTTST